MKRYVTVALPPVDEAYPWRAVVRGLERIGYTVRMGAGEFEKSEFLVTWSPWNQSFRQALAGHFERAGKPVIVLENGWLSPLAGQPFYQAALGGWNGTGRLPLTADRFDRRWRSWGVSLAPWVEPAGRHALVIGQKGGPNDDRTAAPDWHENVVIGRETVIRRSPRSSRPLALDLAQACEVHVWTSNAASWALAAGVPVIQHGPNLMVSELASRPGQPLKYGDREAVFSGLAEAQWTADELSAGTPFTRLLDCVI